MSEQIFKEAILKIQQAEDRLDLYLYGVEDISDVEMSQAKHFISCCRDIGEDYRHVVEED